ncbi:MAG TPA: glycosyltransferase [Verrucomicrobiae bacterium]|nr:glycosyltransferase [Verrucomicrobiae bacterium]
MIQLVAIVSSCNRAPLLAQALASLAEYLPRQHLESALVVFDAGSTDGSREVIRAAQEKAAIPIHLVDGAADNSFAAGVNAATKFALEKYPSTKYLLLFETDNVLRSAEPLQEATELLERRRTLAAIGFTARKHDGSRSGFGCPFPTWLQFVMGPQLTALLLLDRPMLRWRKDSKTKWAECDAVYTSPILIRREAWEQSSGFDAQNFPFSDCDLDWSWRLEKAGLKEAILETDDVIHDNQSVLSKWSATRALYFHRARLKLLRRHRSRLGGWPLPLLLLRHLLECLALACQFSSGKQYCAQLQTRWRLLRGAISNYR